LVELGTGEKGVLLWINELASLVTQAQNRRVQEEVRSSEVDARKRLTTFDHFGVRITGTRDEHRAHVSMPLRSPNGRAQPPRAQRGVGWSELLARFREFAC